MVWTQLWENWGELAVLSNVDSEQLLLAYSTYEKPPITMSQVDTHLTSNCMKPILIKVGQDTFKLLVTGRTG